MFGNRPMGKGLWKMELLESSNKDMMKNAGAMAGMGICMDAATEMAQNVQQNPNDAKQKCETRILKNTATTAEIEVSCPSGTKVHSTMTAESKDSCLMSMNSTSKNRAPLSMKARYRYAGACKSDGLIQMDGNSAQCAQIKAQLSKMDPATSCGKLTGDRKAACEAQINAARAQMRKMCP